MQQNEVYFYPQDYVLRPFLRFVPSWITPNRLTATRFAMTPVVLWLLWEESYQAGTWLFFIAAFTDMLDGSLARVKNKITPWGVFFDPIADKLLIGSVLILIASRFLSWWVIAPVIIMEAAIALGALYRRGNGKMNHANVWGKVKMFAEFAALMFLLIGINSGDGAGYANLAENTLLLALVFGGISYATYSP